jgi:hypothetical protein
VFLRSRQKSVSHSGCYEFLHATFGGYLVTHEVVDTLVETAAGAVGRRGAENPTTVCSRCSHMTGRLRTDSTACSVAA